jgi:hypothetical protein
MKRAVRFFVMMGLTLLTTIQSDAQKKYYEERMYRDIEVTENILSTVIKQQLDKRSFFPMEITGEYREGYGVTYRLPFEINGPMVWGVSSDLNGVRFLDGPGVPYSFSFDSSSESEDLERTMQEEKLLFEKNKQALEEGIKARNRAVIATTKRNSRSVNADSMRNLSNVKIIDACKEFITDYGDLVTQLPADEKIAITNRMEGERLWYGAFVNSSKPSYIHVEVEKRDLNEYKQGKITRDTFQKRIKVINSVMDDELQPDLELITSIFNRLYRPDLSKTFFTEENVYYERMKDYGVIYYMHVYSSNANSGFYRREDLKYSMPTIGLDDLSQAERDKKVVELYPKFEKDIKADMLEYGRTIKSLKPDESLVFNIQLTKCDDCGIPETLELTVKQSVLSDYASGKLNKDAAIGKIGVKKIGKQ